MAATGPIPAVASCPTACTFERRLIRNYDQKHRQLKACDTKTELFADWYFDDWYFDVATGLAETEEQKSDGVKAKSINATLAVVRRILNLAASEWMDDRGMTWLEIAPKIRLFPVTDARLPYPLSAEEQLFLFRELPAHLAKMALFKVNTGTREQEVCGLKWSHEVKVPESTTSVFLISAERVKNGEERLVVLNRVARSVIDSLRGKHPEFVFVQELKKRDPRPIRGMNSTAWKSARERAAKKWAEMKREPAAEGFRRGRVHDLKHTFGRRLRAAAVSFEDRPDLLGHKSGRITSTTLRLNFLI